MIRDDEKNRRDFLKNLAVAGGLVAAAPVVAEAATAAAPCAPQPTSAEVSNAAYDPNLTYQLVQKYRLTATDLSQLIDRLPVKPVPW